MSLAGFPTPPVPYSGHSPVHFCTEAVLRSPFHLTQFQDRGALDLSPQRIVFTGMQALVDCPKVRSITRAGMPFPWFAGALMAFVLGGGLAYAARSRGWHPATPVAVLVFVAAWSVIVWRRVLIQVEYDDAAGSPRRIFFISDPPFGSSRRATLRLLDEMTAAVFPPGRGASS